MVHMIYIQTFRNVIERGKHLFFLLLQIKKKIYLNK